MIDTPGVKMFGLWGVTRENLDEFFPDVRAGTAPAWPRRQPRADRGEPGGMTDPRREDASGDTDVLVRPDAATAPA